MKALPRLRFPPEELAAADPAIPIEREWTRGWPVAQLTFIGVGVAPESEPEVIENRHGPESDRENNRDEDQSPRRSEREA